METSSLSSVSPPDVWYRVSIPEEVIDRGCLSALQLEAITYAAQVNLKKKKKNGMAFVLVNPTLEVGI